MKDYMTLDKQIEALYSHYSGKWGCDITKASRADPTDIAYWYACECFCQGWSLDNGEKALYRDVVRNGIATVCLQRKVILDIQKFTEEDYIVACQNAVDKVLKMYRHV